MRVAVSLTVQTREHSSFGMFLAHGQHRLSEGLSNRWDRPIATEHVCRFACSESWAFVHDSRCCSITASQHPFRLPFLNSIWLTVLMYH
jgi:hypothetical protein